MLSLQYCHDKKISHRTLKTDHLLLDESFNLVVDGFGCAIPPNAEGQNWKKIYEDDHSLPDEAVRYTKLVKRKMNKY